MTHVRFIKMLTLLRCCRDKIANFSRLHCLAIRGRDLNTKKTKSNVEKMTRKPRNHVRILRYGLFQYSLLNQYRKNSLFRGTYLLHSGFQSSLQLIYFPDGPNNCSHCNKVWHKTSPICDFPLSISARLSFAPSQKSRSHNRSCV